MNNNIWSIKQNEKICCFDIDGVLNNYPECWLDFIEEKTFIRYSDLNIAKAHLPYDLYRKLKDNYRKSGVKEKLPVNPEASEVTKKLKELGYTIVILTARPVQEYPGLYLQTLNWLHNNQIYFDAIYFGDRHKHAKILTEMHNIKFMVEDNSYIANQISKFGYKVFLMNNKYNNNLTLETSVTRIEKLSDILEHLQ